MKFVDIFMLGLSIWKYAKGRGTWNLILISMKVSAFFVIICLKFVVLIGVGNFSDEFNIISAYYNWIISYEFIMSLYIYVDFMYDFIVIKLDSFFAVTRRKLNIYLAIFNVSLIIISKCNYYQLYNNI